MKHILIIISNKKQISIGRKFYFAFLYSLVIIVLVRFIMNIKAKVALIVVASVIAVLFIALMIYYFGATFKNFDAIAKQEFSIPGLDTNFSPQGLTYSEDNEMFLVSGYMSKGEPSRVYFIKKGDSKAEKYITLTQNGEAYNGHCGGITTSGEFAWIVGDKQIYRFNLADALATENGKSLEIIDSRETGNGADFVLTYNNQIIVGEFYRKQNYPTPESHHITTLNGKVNPALSFIYDLDEGATCGISEKPVAGISMPEFVQGMTFTKEGKIILSTSYGLPSSKLLIYKNVLGGETSKATIDGQELPVYMLSDVELEKTIEGPCMSEEIVLVDNRVFVLFENACSKYKMFTRTRLTNVYSLDV